MTTIAEALRDARARLQATADASAALDARVLLADVLGVTHAHLVGWPEEQIEASALARFWGLVDRRVDHEPVAHLLGHREFWGLRFAVSPATLIPRPDTETLVEAALSCVPSRDAAVTILDIGTGTGCVLIALLHELRNAHGIGVDIVPEALALAEANARALDLAARVQWILDGDLKSLPTPADMLVANLPYVPSVELPSLARDVVAFEPRRALDGGVDGLSLFRRFAPRLNLLLRPGGVALFEVGHEQAAAVQAVLSAQPGFELTRVWADLAGAARVVGCAASAPKLQFSLGKRGSGS